MRFPENWVGRLDPAYEDARQIYNLAHQAHPAIIARVSDAHEIRVALSYAEAEGLPVAVRGGGHSIAGFGSVEDGLVIDLQRMCSIEAATQTGEYWVGGGALAGDVANVLAQEGVVIPLGDSPEVGIAGITLGGGIGWLTRKFGLTLDSLTAAEIVMADGTLLQTDDAREPDLFWALRGGGGQFGVVTRLRFRPHRLTHVLGGTMVLPLTASSLEDLLQVAAEAPDELGIIGLAMRPPGDVHASPILKLTLVWSGDSKAGQEALVGLRALASPTHEKIQTMPYVDMFQMSLAGPQAITNATETLFADQLGEVDVAYIIEAVSESTTADVLSVVELRPLGGALARVPASETAFAHRDRKLVVSAVRAGFPLRDYAEHRAWVEAFGEGLAHVTKGKYLNFIERAPPADSALIYGTHAARLSSLKQVFDPRNVFARNVPIPLPRF